MRCKGLVPAVAAALLWALPAAALVVPYWETVDKPPPAIDRLLYCSEVMLGLAVAATDPAERARLAADYDRLLSRGVELLLAAGWTEAAVSERVSEAYMPEVEANWRDGALRYAVEDCAALE